jgi:hypothetical protein
VKTHHFLDCNDIVAYIPDKLALDEGAILKFILLFFLKELKNTLKWANSIG